MKDKEELIIKIVLDAWYARVQQADKLFALLSDEQLQNEVAPSKNRGIYLLGHLTTVHDKMFPLLNFRESFFPSLYKPFAENPDKAINDIPSLAELKSYWTTVNTELGKHFNNLQPNEWLEKHTAVSEEDFIKEPHRNRLNIVISRTNHLSYHLGQLMLLKK